MFYIQTYQTTTVLLEKTVATKENRSHNSESILSTYSDTERFNFWLKILPSNQRLCYGNNMRPCIRKLIHVWVRREIIYPLIKNESSSYLRFIDDIFMVWNKSENELKSFINEVNKKHHSIKFGFKFKKKKKLNF